MNGHTAAPADSELGMAVAVGDVNGDGIPDLIIGSDRYNGSSGRVIVIFGTKNGFPDPIDPSTMSASTGVTLSSPDANYFGGTLAVGDVNGDGLADIVIGSTNTNEGGLAHSGAVFVIFGHTGAWSSQTISYVTLGSVLDGTHGVGFTGVAANVSFPQSLAVRDVNGDGMCSDIIAVAASGTVVGQAGGGGAFVIFGSSTFLGSRLPPATTLTTTSGSTAASVASYTGLMVGQLINASSLSSGRGTFISSLRRRHRMHFHKHHSFLQSSFYWYPNHDGGY